MKPTFSLVIPCYNDGRYAPGQYIDRLLNSVVEQGIEKDDLEVIVVDDHSIIPYQGTLDRYRGKLNIKYIETDYNCCPGNTRQKGVTVATGEWLCFADHDDVIAPAAFRAIKMVLTQTNEKYMFETDFNKVDSNDLSKVIEEFRYPNLGTWIHGKFYNLENFWKPFKLHFLKDLKTHEDIALGKLVECAMHKLRRKPTYVNIISYKWTYNKDSISHKTYTSQKIGGVTYSFLETHFDDFLASQISSLFDAYRDENITQDEAKILVLTAICSSYNHICAFKMSHKKKYLKTSEAYVSRLWDQAKQLIELSYSQAKVILTSALKNEAKQIDSFASWSNQLPLIEWLKFIDEMDYNAVIDKELAHQINNTKKSFVNTVDTKAHRPFFSIVIACYNDGRYKEGNYLDRLLSSISRQGVPKEDLEVILSDDCSPTPYDSIVARHQDEFIIKRIKTDYNCCPGNTREKGVTLVTGEWLCFADHDDIFYDGALAKMKNAIIEKNEQHFAFGDFYGVSPEGEVTKKFECHLNWCHGKFYNKDNFWDRYNIAFIHDLKSHEDIAICTQVSCALSSYIKDYTYLHTPIYAWTDNPESVSHAKYTVPTETGPREFLEVFFEDYLHSTGFIYIDKFKQHNVKFEHAVKGIIEIMCYAYFYTQGFQFRRPDDYYKRNLEVAGEYIDICKKTFNFTNQSIYDVVASGNATMYYQVRELADPGSGRYIPTQTFKDWLQMVSPE